ncbi:MAG: hypothetical protein PHN98_11715 [Smithellaceae bacterium]|nr:hypothetical protein [Smithellaceae bacterium]
MAERLGIYLPDALRTLADRLEKRTQQTDGSGELLGHVVTVKRQHARRTRPPAPPPAHEQARASGAGHLLTLIVVKIWRVRF